MPLMFASCVICELSLSEHSYLTMNGSVIVKQLLIIDENQNELEF